MITVENVTLSFGGRTLFEDVNTKFTPGNCYGLIGANGAGKSTFLKILQGDIEPSAGGVHIPSGQRLAVLKQNHNAFDDVKVIDVVVMGHTKLYEIIKEKDAIYAKPDFSEEDGIKAGELEAEFAELSGWDAEPEAASLLGGLNIEEAKHHLTMGELEAKEKVRVLLAQALFGTPDILLLDEPTNNLDYESIKWLEEFLINFQNTVIVVSHDRHFLDTVCTHIADLDFGKIQLYTGNYTFWYESSQLMLQQMRDKNKKVEDKRKELEEFIKRFSANAAKSKQASSRKKMLEKLNVEDIKPSSRKYPHIAFLFEKESGKDILTVDELSYEENGTKFFDKISFVINKGEKVAFVGKNRLAIARLLGILGGELQPTSGEVRWGITTNQTYLPNNHEHFFESDLNLVDWLRQFSPDPDESFVRGFLGKMLFSGEESQKSCNVLSGGEKVRCMLSKMMLEAGNVVVMDEPTDHLDLESITALNNGLKEFKGNLFFASRDRQLVETIADRIIEFNGDKMIDSYLTYEEYLEDETILEKRSTLYA